MGQQNPASMTKSKSAKVNAHETSFQDTPYTHKQPRPHHDLQRTYNPVENVQRRIEDYPN